MPVPRSGKVASFPPGGIGSAGKSPRTARAFIYREMETRDARCGMIASSDAVIPNRRRLLRKCRRAIPA